MTRVAKGKRSRPAYVCTRAKGGAGCVYKSVRCDLIEAALLRTLGDRLTDLEGAVGSDETLDDEVVAAETRLEGLSERIGALIDNLSFERSPALAQRLRQQEADFEEAREALRSLQERREAVTGRTVAARVSRVLEALQPPSGDPIIADINLALRSVFDRAVIDWEARRIILDWTHGGSMAIPYPEFSKWTGPGWVWSDEEEVNAE